MSPPLRCLVLHLPFPITHPALAVLPYAYTKWWLVCDRVYVEGARREYRVGCLHALWDYRQLYHILLWLQLFDLDCLFEGEKC